VNLGHQCLGLEENATADDLPKKRSGRITIESKPSCGISYKIANGTVRNKEHRKHWRRVQSFTDLVGQKSVAVGLTTERSSRRKHLNVFGVTVDLVNYVIRKKKLHLTFYASAPTQLKEDTRTSILCSRRSFRGRYRVDGMFGIHNKRIVYNL
jgi:hypothetical protein